jgi:hypothetical protein
MWRLSDRSDGSLGLSCTSDGLFLGRTPLLERRSGRFAVREKGELNRLFRAAYGDRLSSASPAHSFGTVAAALNDRSPALAAIAALYLHLPELPGYSARAALEAEDRRIAAEKTIDSERTELRRSPSFGGFDPAKHPRWPVGRPEGGEFRPADGSDGDGGLSPLLVSDKKEPSDTAPDAGRQLEKPPDIPSKEPPTARERNTVFRHAAEWLARAMALGLSETSDRVRNFLDVLHATAWAATYLPLILSHLDPPKSLEELQNAVDEPRPGYEIHHIVEEQATSRNAQGNSRVFSEEQLQGHDNLVRIPYWKHRQINDWYSTLNRNFGQQTPREYLRGKSWDEHYELGLDALRQFGVLK